ncbi:Tensin phosphatase [Pelomyxa schiedti]|nr:Tensin phosphatase [Pelomyxa schiedti]
MDNDRVVSAGSESPRVKRRSKGTKVLAKRHPLPTRELPESPLDVVTLLNVLEKKHYPASLLLQLREKIDSSPRDWTDMFIQSDGLNAIIRAIQRFDKKTFHFAHASCQCHLILCLKSLLSSKESIELLVAQHKSLLQRMLDTVSRTSNLLVRSQILQIFSVITLSSPEARQAMLTATRDITDSSTKTFKMLCTWANESFDDQLTWSCIAFINTLVNSPADLEERISIRTLFVDLAFNDTLMIVQKKFETNPDIQKQIEAFLLQMDHDRKKIEEIQACHNLDLSDPEAVFKIVLLRLKGTPHISSILNILRHMLLLSENSSQFPWEFIEKIFHRALDIKSEDTKNQEYKLSITELSEILKKQHAEDERSHCHQASPPPPPPPPAPPPPCSPSATPLRGSSMANIGNLRESGSREAVCPHTPLRGSGEADPNNNPPPSPVPPAPPLPGATPPPPPPPGGRGRSWRNTPGADAYSGPAPRVKLRQFFWLKLSNVNNTMWVKREVVDSKIIPLEEMEELFPQNPKVVVVEPKPASKPKFLLLLDTKRSNNVSIGLSQFKNMTQQQIIDAVNDASEELSVENLQTLSSFAPTKEELDLITSYAGDINLLPKAELFFREVSRVPMFQEKVLSLLFKVRFFPEYQDLSEKIQSWNTAMEEITNCKGLSYVMQVILLCGNFMNYGTPQGNATGFKIETLKKLKDLRSPVNAAITLLKYVVKLVVITKPEHSKFPGELKHLTHCCKYPLGEMVGTIGKLQQDLQQNLSSLAKQPDPVFKAKMESSFQEFDENIKNLSEDFKNLQQKTNSIVTSFGEDPSIPTTIPEFFSTLATFSSMWQETYKGLLVEQQQEATKRSKELQAQNKKVAANAKAPKHEKCTT